MSHIRSPSALIFGLLCLTGTVIVLFGHIRHLDDLTLNHLYIMLALIVTLGSGHFMWDAYAVGWWGIARGLSFTTLFVVGTLVCVGLSGGRSAAIIAQHDFDAQQIAVARAKQQGRVDAASDAVAAIKSQYDTAKATADEALAKANRECATGKGTLCLGKRDSANALATAVQALYAQKRDAEEAFMRESKALDAIKPLPPPNTDLAAFAHIYAFFAGIPESTALDTVKLLLPYGFSLLTEFGAIAFFQHAFAPSTPAPIVPTITIADIARDLAMKPDEARKALRTMKVPKPPQGWVWSVAEAQAIRATIRNGHPSGG